MSVIYSSQSWHKLDDFFNEHLLGLGFELNAREVDIHTLFSTNLKGENLSIKPGFFFDKIADQKQISFLF